MKIIDIAFIADSNMEVGLHVALASLSIHLSDGVRARCHLFLDDIVGERKDSLIRTVQSGKKNMDLYFYELQLDVLNDVRGLHFSQAPLKVLRIPELIDAESFVYLDSDVVVLSDISSLAMSPKTSAVGACAITTVGKCWIKERRLLQRAGVQNEELYYNTGVMLIDREKWMSRGLPAQWLNFIGQFGRDLVTADQSVINGAFRKELFPIENCWNAIWRVRTPLEAQTLAVAKVLHFVGSQKPWDLFGNRIHSGIEIFEHYLAKTDIAQYNKIPRRLASYLRAIRLGRSYWKNIMTKISP